MVGLRACFLLLSSCNCRTFVADGQLSLSVKLASQYPCSCQPHQHQFICTGTVVVENFFEHVTSSMQNVTCCIRQINKPIAKRNTSITRVVHARSLYDHVHTLHWIIDKKTAFATWLPSWHCLRACSLSLCTCWLCVSRLAHATLRHWRIERNLSSLALVPTWVKSMVGQSKKDKQGDFQ